MIDRRAQKGSAHVVIIVVLVLALIGALGYIFWQGLSGASKTNTRSTTQSKSDTGNDEVQHIEPKVKTISLAMNTVFPNGSSLEYPEGWKVKHLKPQGDIPPRSDGTTVDTYIFTSPDESIDLSLSQNAGGGIGGWCEPKESPTIATFLYEVSDVWPTKAYAEYTYKGDQQKYYAHQGLASADNAKSIKAGDSLCKAGYIYFVETEKKVESVSSIYLVSSVSKHGVNESLSFSDAQSAKAYLESQNAKDIKSMILSIR